MSAEPCETAHLLLQAELDGELDAAGSAGLASHLTGCAACRDLRDRLGALSARLRTLPRHEVTPGLRAAVTAGMPRPHAAWRRLDWTHAGAFGAGLALAATMALAFLPRSGPGTIADLMSAHVRALQPGHLLDVPSSDQHTVKPWFNGRIDFSPDVPDLASQGFPLLGGRLDHIGDRPAAVLVYGRRQHVIDVFVQAGDPGTAVRSSGGYNVAQWTAGGLGYRAVSDLNKDELAAFTTLMRRQGSQSEGAAPRR